MSDTQVTDLSARVARMIGKEWVPFASEVIVPQGAVLTTFSPHPHYATDLSACLRDVVPWLISRGWKVKIEVEPAPQSAAGPYALVTLMPTGHLGDGAERVAMLDGPLDATLARLLCECALEVGEAR